MNDDKPNCNPKAEAHRTTTNKYTILEQRVQRALKEIETSTVGDRAKLANIAAILKGTL